jgi:tRNA dimethylallyltransferase
VPLVVGGTGFYVRALTDPLDEAPVLDGSRRARLAALLEPLGVDELRRWALRLDPPRAHLGRTQLLRAVEVALLTGRPLSSWHRGGPSAPAVAARYLVVDPGREALQERIVSRVGRMLDDGWEAEVRELRQRVPPEAPAWNASGYAAVRRLVDGTIDRETCVAEVVIATRQYAKRQRTWLRHQLGGADVTWLDPRAADALPRAERWWHGEASPAAGPGT